MTELGRFAEFLRLHNRKDSDCVEWPHSVASTGYGDIRIGGKHLSLHRLSCEIAYGPPPTPRHEAAHSCHNRACINPRHLRWATRQENQQDRVQDGTSNRGSRHGMSKLCETDIREIRRQVSMGTPQKDVAAKFGVSGPTVSNIIQGVTWGHVTEGDT